MFFKFNFLKFDSIYFSNPFRLLDSLPSIGISTNLSLASPSTIHSLDFTFDSSLSLIPQIIYVAKSFSNHLRHIKRLKIFLDNPTLKLLVSSLILSHFDYSNSLYYGLPETTLHPLTKAFNRAVPLVSGTQKFSLITPTLISTLVAS